MCGINLIVDKTKSLGPDTIKLMTKHTNHRGPDESKIYARETRTRNFYLGANRLKISDISEFAAQPFLSEDGKYALLFNGEIYNHYDLKNELLGKGIRFSSYSDTEVLLQWVITFGTLRLDELQGMFAFVLVDFESEYILMSRDRFGIKPLHYYQDDRYTVVSSEIQPLIKTELFPKKLNETQIAHYLRYKYAQAPETVFQDVFELQPGTYCEVCPDKIEHHSLLKSQQEIEPKSFEVADVEHLLKASVLQQINSSVPVGLLLSGGVDSTLILALARSEGFSIPSYSIVNTAKEQSFGTEDFRYARQAAKQFESDHHQIEMDISLLEQLESLVSRMDQPLGDSSYLVTSEICKYASTNQQNEQANIKVLISGAGADELFGGYNRHWAFYKYLKYYRQLKALKAPLDAIASNLPTGFSHPLRKKFRLMQKFVSSVSESPETTFHNFLTFQEFHSSDSFSGNTSMESNEHWLSWALQHDFKNYLPNDVLALSDRASMMHGVELRVPYLSEDLQQYLNATSSELIMSKGKKWVLKEILKKYGGKAYAKRSKEGFGMPLGAWLVNDKCQHLWEFAEVKEQPVFNFVSKDRLTKLLQEQKRRAADHGPLLWAILVLAHWLNHNFS